MTATEATDTEITELPDDARRALRRATIALRITLFGLVVAGVSIGLWARQIADESADSRRESAQTTWDQQTAERKVCTDLAKSRAVTLETRAADFEADMRQITGRLDMTDLLESIALLFPPSEIIDQALDRIAEQRGRVQSDAIELAADYEAYKQVRPPLDPNVCPPPPDGPRP